MVHARNWLIPIGRYLLLFSESFVATTLPVSARVILRFAAMHVSIMITMIPIHPVVRGIPMLLAHERLSYGELDGDDPGCLSQPFLVYLSQTI